MVEFTKDSKELSLGDLASALAELSARVDRLEGVVQVTVSLSDVPIK